MILPQFMFHRAGRGPRSDQLCGGDLRVHRRALGRHAASGRLRSGPASGALRPHRGGGPQPELQARLAEQLPGVRVVANPTNAASREPGTPASNSPTPKWWSSSTTMPPPSRARSRVGAPLLRSQRVGRRRTHRPVGGPPQRPACWPPEFDWVVGCNYTGQHAGVVRNLIGANASFRRELFADGGFVTGIGRSATAPTSGRMRGNRVLQSRAGQARPEWRLPLRRPGRGRASRTRRAADLRVLPFTLLLRGAVEGSSDRERRSGNRIGLRMDLFDLSDPPTRSAPGTWPGGPAATGPVCRRRP